MNAQLSQTVQEVLGCKNFEGHVSIDIFKSMDFGAEFQTLEANRTSNTQKV